MKEQEVKAALMAAGIENAGGEARILCAEYGECVPREAVEKRCLGYPLQYILGTWGFFREEYEVNEHCLIPRSDTEILVEKAIEYLPQNAKFLDLCTGSGCVAISTLASRTDTVGIAVDLFEETLAVAKRNAVRNRVETRISFYLADVTCAPVEFLKASAPYAAILSNPPYITANEMKDLQKEVRFEPEAALYGGEDGLLFYRAILKNYTSLLAESGFFLFEIGASQKADLKRLATELGMSFDSFQDYGGNDRVVLIRKRVL